jgi:hypothetical protein
VGPICPNEAYGGRIDHKADDWELHPERVEAVLAAMDRHEAEEDTAADRVLLWFDVMLNELLLEHGKTQD